MSDAAERPISFVDMTPEPPRAKQSEMFGIEQVDEFKVAKDRYGIWPVTVWDCNMQDQKTRKLKALIGDRGQAREGSQKGGGCYQDFPSIFNPAVASWILNCFAPDSGTCFDPFAGGGTRAIMAAKHGLQYVGVELRANEALETRRRAEANDCTSSVDIMVGDARDCTADMDAGVMDFLITCPPYWNLEKYDGGPGDLSMIEDCDAFFEQMAIVVRECYRLLRPGALACWVIGLHRHPDGTLAPLHHSLSHIHAQAGFALQEEIVLSHKNNGAVQRVGNFERGKRRLIRTHEYVMVYRKPE